MNLIVCIIILFTLNLQLNSQIVVNELMIAPRSGEPEWLELYNPSQTAITITKAKLKDLSGVKEIGDITINANDFLVVCSDTAALKTFYTLHSAAKLLQKTIPSLNNTTDAILLLDSNSQIIDSTYYDFKWGAAPSSLERFDYAKPAISKSNWKKCIVNSFATPCAFNSTSRREFDVTIENIKSNKDTVQLTIKNIGRNKTNPFILTTVFEKRFTKDRNFELTRSIQEIQSDDSVIIDIGKIQISNLFSGAVNIKNVCSLQSDQNRQNDTSLFADFISAPESNIRINEIMYDPETGFCEFIELWNPTGDSVFLYGLQYYENVSAKSGLALINIKDTLHSIAPNSYFVVASDSTIFSRMADLSKVIIVNKNLELNSNDGDMILLKDANGTTLDSLIYAIDWHSKFSENNKNKSLEKTNPNLESKFKSNWTTSSNLRGNTPGEANSSLSETKANTISIEPNPFIKSNSKDGICRITMNTNFTQAKITAQILDLTAAIRRTITLAEPVGKEINLLWDGRNDKGDNLDSGAYIFYYEITNLADGELISGKELLVIGQ